MAASSDEMTLADTSDAPPCVTSIPESRDRRPRQRDYRANGPSRASGALGYLTARRRHRRIPEDSRTSSFSNGPSPSTPDGQGFASQNLCGPA